MTGKSTSLPARARATARLIAEHAPKLEPSRFMCLNFITNEFTNAVKAEFLKVKKGDKKTGKC